MIIHRTRLTRRGLIGLVVAVLVAMVPLAAPVAANQDPQSIPVDHFAGYHGLVTEAGGAAAVDESAGKSEALGDVGVNSGTLEDVPGEGGLEEAAPDGAVLQFGLPKTGVGGDVASIEAAVAEGGVQRAVVTLRTPIRAEAALDAVDTAEQRATIAKELKKLDVVFAGTGSSVLTPFTATPAAIVELDSAGLAGLLSSPLVGAITPDGEGELALDVSTGVIDSDLLNAAGVLGDNYNGSTGGAYEVAILDSGVDNAHAAFSGRIVAQACFSAGSDCPNGLTSQIGGNAGDDCGYSTQCDHGTHVAGIAAGSFYAGGHEGVARGARIVAVQIGHDSVSCGTGPNPCWRYFFSDLDLALQHVLNLRNGGRNIASINLSLGGPLYTSEALCDAGHPNTAALASQLQAAGVGVIAAAGNDGSTTQLSYPGCLGNTYAVGATNDVDTPAGFTNSANFMDWWAPGVGTDAAIPGGGTGPKSGTSMATPHVAGAFALLRECIGNSTPGLVAADLSATGVDVTRSGVTKRRINVLDAGTRNINNNDFASPEVYAGNGPINDFDYNTCADAEAGETGGGSIENSIWWTWTPATTGTATISTEDGPSFATTFDTQLSVFTGSALGGLTLLAYDDDGGTGLRSLVTMPVNGGTTYRIQVDGFGGSNGELNLQIVNGPAPLCVGVAATLVGTTGDDVFTGTSGDDVIVSGDGNDTIDGLGGNDRICAGAGTDLVHGGDGNDIITGGPDADTLFGDAGDDTILGNAGAGDTNDVGDVIFGGVGNDVLDGWVGDDVLYGRGGNDVLIGAAGNDFLQGNGDDDSYIGGDGIDTVSFELSLAGVTADLTAGTASGEGSDTFSGVENLIGSSKGDDLSGDANANVIEGLVGADTIRGEAGDDSLFGGAGKDVIDGDDGDDFLKGGSGSDILNGELGEDVVQGSSGKDTLYGGQGDDELFGQKGKDSLFGGANTDLCNGGSGIDTGKKCEIVIGIP